MRFDYYPGLYNRMDDILKSDDRVRFVNLLRDHYDRYDLHSLVNECVEMGASECLIALIRGEVCDMHPTFYTAHLPDCGVTPLAYIAHSCPEESQVIDLMLTKCGGGTYLANAYCTIGAVHGLPLHFLLINLSIMEHLYLWHRGASLVKLVVLLCLWETKPIMDSLRVLVEYTDSINGIAWTVLKNGGLKEFAALALIARKKVIAPFDTGLTIHNYINHELDSISYVNLSVEQEEYKYILVNAGLLLTMFELTCDDLSSYCSSMSKFVSVDDTVDDIMGMLTKDQVTVLSRSDHDLNDLNDCLSDPKEYCARALSGSSPWSHIDYTAKFTPGVALPSYYTKFYHQNGYKAKRGAPLSIPKCLHGRLYSTGACQVRKMSKSLPHASSTVPRHLGYIASKLINRVKFL